MGYNSPPLQVIRLLYLAGPTTYHLKEKNQKITYDSSNWQVPFVVFHVYSCQETSQDKKKCPPSCLFLESKQILQQAFVSSPVSPVLPRVPLQYLFCSWKGRNKHERQLSCILIGLGPFLEMMAFFFTQTCLLFQLSVCNPSNKVKSPILTL